MATPRGRALNPEASGSVSSQKETSSSQPALHSPPTCPLRAPLPRSRTDGLSLWWHHLCREGRARLQGSALALQGEGDSQPHGPWVPWSLSPWVPDPKGCTRTGATCRSMSHLPLYALSPGACAGLSPSSPPPGSLPESHLQNHVHCRSPRTGRTRADGVTSQLTHKWHPCKSRPSALLAALGPLDQHSEFVRHSTVCRVSL